MVTLSLVIKLETGDLNSKDKVWQLYRNADAIRLIFFNA